MPFCVRPSPDRHGWFVVFTKNCQNDLMEMEKVLHVNHSHILLKENPIDLSCKTTDKISVYFYKTCKLNLKLLHEFAMKNPNTYFSRTIVQKVLYSTSKEMVTYVGSYKRYVLISSSFLKEIENVWIFPSKVSKWASRSQVRSFLSL